MKEIKYVTNILYLTLIGSQSLKNIDINVYYGGPLVNPKEINGFPFKGPGIECYYMTIRRKLKTLKDLKMKIMEELNLNPALCYFINSSVIEYAMNFRSTRMMILHNCTHSFAHPHDFCCLV